MQAALRVHADQGPCRLSRSACNAAIDRIVIQCYQSALAHATAVVRSAQQQGCGPNSFRTIAFKDSSSCIQGKIAVHNGGMSTPVYVGFFLSRITFDTAMAHNTQSAE